MKARLLLTVLILGLSACNHSDTGGPAAPPASPQNENEEDEFTFEFSDDNCTTGKHKASSKEELCRKLASGRINKRCAASLRKQWFDQKCEGRWPVLENLSHELITEINTRVMLDVSDAKSDSRQPKDRVYSDEELTFLKTAAVVDILRVDYGLDFRDFSMEELMAFLKDLSLNAKENAL